MHALRSNINKIKILPPALIVLVLISALSLTACGKKNTPVKTVTPISIAKVKVLSAEIYLKEPGHFLPYNVANVSSRSPGQIIKVIARDGDSVKAGQVLAVVDRKKVYFAMKSQEAVVRQKKAVYVLAKSMLKRDTMLFKKQLLTAIDYDRAVSSLKQALSSYDAALSLLKLDKKDYKDTLIVSPIRGIVYKRRINLGDYVNVGTLSYGIVALKPLELEFHVPQSYVPFIKNGETCLAIVKGYPRKIFSGRIYFISPSLDPNTRTVKIKAIFSNNKEFIKPQDFANVKLSVGFVKNGLFVPESSVIIALKGDYLYIYKDGIVKRRNISVGISKNGYLQITKGINKDDTVVVKGSSLVHNNERVFIAKRVG